jgi:hypothetical protein
MAYVPDATVADAPVTAETGRAYRRSVALFLHECVMVSDPASPLVKRSCRTLAENDVAGVPQDLGTPRREPVRVPHCADPYPAL